MLAKQCRITENSDFSFVVKNGTKRTHGCCVVYLVSRETKNHCSSRVGFIVSKKVGNAIIRNLVKRRLREIMANFYKDRSVSFSFDIVIRALPSSVQYSYADMKNVIYDFLDELIERKCLRK